MTRSQLRQRLELLRTIIPSADRRRTARGLLRTCRELIEHRSRVEQLHANAKTQSDRLAIDELVAEIEQRRSAIANGAELVRQAGIEHARRLLRGSSRLFTG